MADLGEALLLLSIDAIAALAGCAGQLVHEAPIHDGLATLVLGGVRFQANLTATPTGDFGHYEWTQTPLKE